MNASEKSFSLTRASSMNRRLGVKVLLLAFWVSGLLSVLSQTNPPAIVPPTNAVTGPTIRLDFGHDHSPGNPVASFMYFVPLISPEPVSSVTSPGSTQVARVLSAKRKSTPNSFAVTCEFEFAGKGSQQSVFDLSPTIRRQERKLKAGGSTGRLLNTITVGGPGSGTVEVEGNHQQQCGDRQRGAVAVRCPRQNQPHRH